jgi:hypothetical protein
MRQPKTEKTAAGRQYVLPGAERKTAPGTVHSQEPNGQLLLGTIEPVSDQERLQARLGSKLRPRKGQKLAAGGLFTPKA